ncbi:MAG: DUF721 domain-containing protein [Elusimicrobia bacterium]|nr:DUF721 domain-containing protein [Elusimicrobiota bacterium]
MRKGKVTHIGVSVDRFLQKNFINVDGYALRVFFSKFIGPKLSKYAELVKFSKDTVYVSVKSSVVKNEILLLRRKIIKGLNEFLGESKIKGLKIVQE